MGPGRIDFFRKVLHDLVCQMHELVMAEHLRDATVPADAMVDALRKDHADTMTGCYGSKGRMPIWY